MHFFNPVHLKPLLEIVRTDGHATPTALDAAVAVGDAHGQGGDRRQGLAGLRDEPARRRARARGDPHGRGGRRVAAGHRHRDGARLRPPDGAAAHDRPRRASTCASAIAEYLDRELPRRPLRAAGAAAEDGRGGQGSARRRGRGFYDWTARSDARGPVTDVHVHVQPWDMLRLPVLRGDAARAATDLADIERLLPRPRRARRATSSAQGVRRTVLINYESPDVMGFTTATNDWVLDFTRDHRDRLLPCVGINPRFEQRRARPRRAPRRRRRAACSRCTARTCCVSPNDYLGALARAARPLRGGAGAPHPRDVPHGHEHLPRRAQQARRPARRSRTSASTSPTST